MTAVSEVAFAAPAAHGAGRLGHPVAVHADVRLAVAAAYRDRRGLPARPALAAGAARSAPADLAQRLPGAGPGGHRPRLAAGTAGSRPVPVAAALAGAPALA